MVGPSRVGRSPMLSRCLIGRTMSRTAKGMSGAARVTSRMR